MKYRHLFTSALLFFTFYIHADTLEYKDLLTAAHEQFKNKNYDKAVELYEQSYALQPLESTLYNVGISRFKLKQWGAALDIFISLQGDVIQYNLITYNIAVIYKKQGNIAKAKELFASMYTESANEKLRALSYRQLLDINSVATPQENNSASVNKFFTIAAFSYGVDDDVVSVNDESNTGDSDTFFETLGLFSWQRKNKQGNQWGADFLYFATKYQRASEYDITLVGASGKKYFQFDKVGGKQLYLGLGYEKLMLGTEDYISSFSFTGDMSIRLYGNTKVSMRFVHKQYQEDDAVYEYLAGASENLGIVFYSGEMDNRMSFGLKLVMDRRNDKKSETSFTSYSANRLTLLGAKNWGIGDCLLSLSGKYRVSTYSDANVVDEIETLTRKDSQFSLVASIEYQISPYLSLTSEANWTNNNSNIESYSYNQHQVMAGLSIQF